jgi:CRISPR-associated protein Csm4
MWDMLGEDKLEEFLKLYSERNPVFTISSSFFERDSVLFLSNTMLPFTDNKKEKTKDEKIKSFLNYKDSKKRKFLTLKQFNYSLKGESEKLIESIESDNVNQPKYIEDLRTSVEIDRNTFSSKESQLFSYAPLYIKEELINTKKNEYTKTNTVLFVKILDEKNFSEFGCENILKEVFKIGFGKKKSSGYGEFEVNGFDKFEGFEEPDISNGFISLSNYLPSKHDSLIDMYYDFILKYGKLGEELALSNNPFKRPILLLTPGSVFFTNENKDFYGRCTIPGEISESYPEAIQNGYSFSLRAKLKNV